MAAAVSDGAAVSAAAAAGAGAGAVGAAGAAGANNAGAANDRKRVRVADPPVDAPRFDDGDDAADVKHATFAADASVADGDGGAAAAAAGAGAGAGAAAGGRSQVLPGQEGWADVADAGPDASDTESMADLDPNHPLLAPVQAALNAQLAKHHERISHGLRQAEAASAQFSKRREQLGVELYNFQKGIALAARCFAHAVAHSIARAALRTALPSALRGAQCV